MEEKLSEINSAVCITGAEAISPYGGEVSDLLNGLISGRNCINQNYISESGKSFRFGQINIEDANEIPFGNSPKELTRLEHFCLHVLQNLFQKHTINPSDSSLLLIISTTKGNVDVLGHQYPLLPECVAFLPELALRIKKFARLANQPMLISNACISGVLAVIQAQRMLQSGKFPYSKIVVLGADIITPFVLSGFASLNALSNSSCKPYDKNRDGINLGEAAAALLIEKGNPAKKIVILPGFINGDANHISGPSRNGDGLFAAVKRTMLFSGGLHPDLISAHGTATQFNDDMESVAFSRAGFNHIPLHSLKGYFGHTLGAAGVLEILVESELMRKSLVLASAGFKESGTTHELNVLKDTIHKPINLVLKTASGFGGSNAAILLRKGEQWN